MTDSPRRLPTAHQWVDRGTDRLCVQCYPDPDPAAPVAVLWPAMGVPAGFYRPFATDLHDAGVAVIVADLRGTGASTPRASRRSRYGYAELVDDVGAVLESLKSRLDGRRVVLVGHSLGGQACLLHVATTGGPQVHGLALIAVGLPYWRVYRRRGRRAVLGFTQSINLTSAAIGVWPGWGFGGRQARGVIRDWAFTARTGHFPDLPGGQTAQALGSVTTPVLAVTYEQDPYTPAPTMDHLLDKLPAAPVHREHYDGGADHFTWARSPGPTAARVARFAHTGD